MMSGGLVFAQVNGTSTDGASAPSNSNNTLSKISNPLKANSIKEVIFLLVDVMIYVGTALAILAIIYVGFKFVLAQGKPDDITEAKKQLGWILVGLAILISAKTIVLIVQNTLSDAGVVDRSVFTGN